MPEKRKNKGVIMESVLREMAVPVSIGRDATFTVHEVATLQAAQDKCLELLQSGVPGGETLPIGHSALVRLGSGAFLRDEYVVLIGSLVPFEDLWVGVVLQAAPEENEEGKFTRLTFKKTGIMLADVGTDLA